MNDPHRSLWLAIFLIVGVLVGAAAGFLTWLTTSDPASAILAGGGAVGATVTFLLGLRKYLLRGE